MKSPEGWSDRINQREGIRCGGEQCWKDYTRCKDRHVECVYLIWQKSNYRDWRQCRGRDKTGVKSRNKVKAGEMDTKTIAFCTSWINKLLGWLQQHLKLTCWWWHAARTNTTSPPSPQPWAFAVIFSERPFMNSHRHYCLRRRNPHSVVVTWVFSLIQCNTTTPLVWYIVRTDKSLLLTGDSRAVLIGIRCWRGAIFWSRDVCSSSVVATNFFTSQILQPFVTSNDRIVDMSY